MKRGSFLKTLIGIAIAPVAAVKAIEAIKPPPVATVTRYSKGFVSAISFLDEREFTKYLSEWDDGENYTDIMQKMGRYEYHSYTNGLEYYVEKYKTTDDAKLI
jgi:hypothetical protein